MAAGSTPPPTCCSGGSTCRWRCWAARPGGARCGPGRQRSWRPPRPRSCCGWRCSGEPTAAPEATAGGVDAVVIGSGPNGLAAAHALARAGRDTLLLEAAPEPGGAMRSDELTLPGFIHDVCSAVYPTAAASPVFAAMRLERHGLRWAFPEVDLAHPLGASAAALVRSVRESDRTLSALGEQHGAYERVLAPLVDAWDAMRAIGLGGWPPFGALLRGGRRLGPRQALAAARLAATPCTAAPGLGDVGRAVLAANGLHADLAPWQRGSAAFGLALCSLAHTVGWPSPVGGASGLRDALLGACR